VAGALADSADKARLLAAGSILLAVTFFLFYLWRPYALNLLIMLFIGVGMGTYEGVADPMLLDLHEKRQGLFISVNHFFVTFGCLAITLYLIFLQMDWRRSIVQSAAVVLALGFLFAFSRAGRGAGTATKLGERLGFLKTQAVLAIFLALVIIGVGLELGLTGLLTSFLMELRGFDQVGSKLGLVLFLAGIAAGRVILGLASARGSVLGLIVGLYGAAAAFSAALFFVPMPVVLIGVVLFLLGMSVSALMPLLVTLTGSLFRDMTGTALGIVKLGIPLGGILVPFVLSVIARYSSFQISLVVFPAFSLAGCVLLAASRRTISSRTNRKP
jgi:predicted MFS family arabinose efflux permease